VDLYLGILAVLTIGAAYVPVDPDDSDERADVNWQEAGVCAVLGQDLNLTLRHDVSRGGRFRRSTPNDGAWIIFTSGSTGRPKGVAVTHRAAAAFVDAEADFSLTDHRLGPEDRILTGLSVAADASCEEMWLAWRHGACLVPAPRRLVRAGVELGPWLLEREIIVASTVPTLAMLWQVEALDRVRLLIFGGEACSPELVDRLSGPRPDLWNTYRPTETTVVACAGETRPHRHTAPGMATSRPGSERLSGA
jgi:non-ribosomal peptide synthetase component F